MKGNKPMAKKLIWQHDRLLLDDLVFRLEPNRNNEWELNEECFNFYKTEGLVNLYIDAFSQKKDFYPRNIFEIGIWDGGSVAFWSEYFQPEKHVAIDLKKRQDSPYFRHYVASRRLQNRIKTYWATAQADSQKIMEIVKDEFVSPLDLVIDDASHLYEPTKTSFETLFPYLREGGLYVIENWNWAYLEEYQTRDHPWSKETPLTKLIFELVEAVGATPLLIQDLIVYRNFVLIERGSQPLEPGEFRLEDSIPKFLQSIQTTSVVETDSPQSTARDTLKQKKVSLETSDIQADQNMLKLNKIFEQAPADASPKRLFGEVDDDFWFWLHTEGYRNSAKLRDVLPGLPDDQTQLGFTGQTGDANLATGFKAYKLFKQIALDNLESSHQLNAVLDFGCGWGRIIRFFQKDIDPANLWGADSMNFAAQVFKEINTDKWSNFVQNNTLPPIVFEDNTFNLVYLNSVFSHLSEEAHEQWLTEFSRILKPDGILIATTWGKDFIYHCANQRKKPISERKRHENNWANSFVDTEQALQEFEQGKFLFAPALDIGSLEHYGNSCIPKGYVLSHWTKLFDFVDFIDDQTIYPQNVIVVRK